MVHSEDGTRDRRTRRRKTQAEEIMIFLWQNNIFMYLQDEGVSHMIIRLIASRNAVTTMTRKLCNFL